VKGRTYTVDELLGGEEKGRPFHDGYFMTIYLSPRHYHRIHSPVAGEVVRWHHIPGQLFPVNPPSVRSVDRLFAINERMISYVRMGGPGSPEVAVVKVGAIGVGRIALSYCEAVTNEPGQLEREVVLDPPYPVRKGDELGVFELGSTVIVVFPPNLVAPGPFVAGDEVKMGQRVASLVPGK
jgi:phosphatidylserine decarboxylase